MNLLRSIKDWQNRRRIHTEERRRSQRSTFSLNHPGAIYPILQIVLLQNSQRGKEFNKFCPLNKSDDLLPFLMYLSFFYDLAGNYFYTICCELRISGLGPTTCRLACSERTPGGDSRPPGPAATPAQHSSSQAQESPAVAQ